MFITQQDTVGWREDIDDFDILKGLIAVGVFPKHLTERKAMRLLKSEHIIPIGA